MSDRFSFSLPKGKIIRRFNVKVPGLVVPQYNISPGQTVSIITDEQPQQLTPARWGISTDRNALTHQLHLKSTTQKPIARTAQLITRRCLILADGFYIWKRVSRKSRVPYRVTLKWNIPFAFAGVWQPAASEIPACAIVTTDANELMAPLVGRMPVILPLEQEREWLRTDATMDEVLSHITPYPSEQMRLFPVSMQVNQPELNTVELTLPSQPADQFGNYVLFE